MACLKLPAPRCGATSSHRERLLDGFDGQVHPALDGDGDTDHEDDDERIQEESAVLEKLDRTVYETHDRLSSEKQSGSGA